MNAIQKSISFNLDCLERSENYSNNDSEKENQYLSHMISLLESYINKHSDEKSHQIVMAYNNLAHIYRKLGNNEKAILLFNTLLNLQISIFGEIHVNISINYNNIGKVFYNLG